MKLFTTQEIKSSEEIALDSGREKQRILSSVISKREKELQELNVQIELKRKEKLEEISSLEQKILELSRSEIATIKVLEERRNAALAPINDEIDKLDLSRREIIRLTGELLNKEAELKHLQRNINEAESILKKKLSNFEGYKTVSFEEIERRKRVAESSEEMAQITIKNLQEEQERASTKRKGLEEKEESMKRAEYAAKQAIAEADKKIAVQTVLQHETDEKRKLLANAIKELKKKGLWHKLEEMGIK